jgi:oligosaccharide repeat unit polymerase
MGWQSQIMKQANLRMRLARVSGMKSPHPFRSETLDMPLRPPSLIYIILLVALLIAGALALRVYDGCTENDCFIPFVVLFGTMLTVWAVRKWYAKGKHNWLTPDTLFMMVFSVFHFGYIIPFAFNAVKYDAEVFWQPSVVMQATYYCFSCLLVFLIGHEVGGVFNSRRLGRAQSMVNAGPVLLGSRILIVVSIVFFWGSLAAVGITRVLTDYELLQVVGIESPWGRLYWSAYGIGLVGIAFYCASSGLMYRKALNGPLFRLLVLAFIFGILMLGDRGGFMYFIVVPILAFHYFHRRIRSYEVLFGIIALFFVMNVLAITRTTVLLDLKSIAQEYSEKRNANDNPVFDTFIEFGESLKTVVIAIELVPARHHFWMGESYFRSLTIAVPNIIPGHIRTANASVDTWLTETAFGSLKHTYGRGGSIAMEAYMNFGVAGGVVTFFVLGFSCRWLYERFLHAPSIENVAVLFGCMSALLVWVRNTSQDPFRTILWVVGAACLSKLASHRTAKVQWKQ